MRTLVLALLLGLLPSLLAAQPPAPEPASPLVAVAPVILQKSARLDSIDQKEAAPLAERVQLALEAGRNDGHRFVERIALDTLLREQSLALSGFADSGSAIRTGRLLRADWILRLRLRADDLPHPRVEAEVIDALRADLLGRASTSLPRLPDESWLLQPSDAVVEITRACAADALEAARLRSASLAGKTALAPLVFVNRDQSDRLAPLAGLLLAALNTDHPKIRVLDFERPDGAMDESVLFHAGMIDLDPADWSRVADGYLWGEFFEEGGAARLELKLWRDGREARSLSFQGPTEKLEDLARRAAAETLETAVGARVEVDQETRARAARRLLDASAAFLPKPGRPWDDSARNRAHQEARLRYLTLAAFFSPENPMLREQVCSLGLSLARDDKTRAAYHRQFWRTFDQFLFNAGGQANLSLIARAAAYQADFPGYAARFERIGRILAKQPLDDRTMSELCDDFSSASLSLPDEPGLDAAKKIMEPLLRRHGRRSDANSLPGARQAFVPSGPVFTAWQKTPAAELLESARSGPLVKAPSLDAPQVRFSPWQLVPATGSAPPPTRLVATAVGDDALWLVNFVPADNREARACSAARLDLNTHELEWLPARLSAEAPVSDVWLEESRVWLSTRGNGLRVLDRGDGRVKVLDQTAGLATADIAGLRRGRDGLFLEPAANAQSAVVTRIDLRTATLGEVAAPGGADFSTLSSALRAAIASFGDDASPRVKLPSVAAIGFDDSATPPTADAPVPDELPASHRLGSAAEGRYSPEHDPAFARHACVTGPRDGYWVASHHSLIWAAGTRRVPVAHWISGCIRSLADDGRHLFVEVIRRASPENTETIRGGSPSNLRIYVYDHAEGRWLGWLSAPHSGPMRAGPGILAIVSDLAIEQPLALINTAALGGGASRPVASARSRSGWTPLLSALWADDASAVDRLLASGAPWDVSDVRGWHPLQLAAAWSSPACLDALLRHGVPGKQPRPAPAPDLPKTYAARRDDRETALHAAVLANRAVIVERLLAAGANPLAFDPLGNPLQLAVRHASPELVARLLSSVTAEKYREPLRLSAEESGRKDLLPLLGRSALAAKPAWRPADPKRRLYEALRPTPPDLEAVRAALADGADPSAFDGSSAPFLQSAARERKFAAFEVLLAATKPEKLNETSRGMCLGASVLRELLAAKRPDLARKLFAAGYKPAPPPDDYDSFGFPTLWLAIACGDAELTRLLRAADFRLANPVPSPRQIEAMGGPAAAASWRPPIPAALQPIPEAVRQGNAELLRALVEPVPFKNADFDIDALSPNGLTSLYEATEAGWTEGVRLLLNAGATWLAGDHHTGRSLQDAASRHPEIALLLNRRPGSPDNQLAGAEAVAAILRGDRSALSTLPLGPDVLRYRDLWGWGALHHAARRGSYELVGRLLSAGASVDTLTAGGESPLCLAVFSGDATCVDLLLTLRARPDLHGGQGWLPLHAAARAGRADLVKRILAAGANPDLPAGPEGDTAVLAAAATRDESESLRLLAAARASLTAVDRAGRGALEAAVLSDSPEKIQFLLDRGVRWQKPRSPGYHPMNVAAENGLVGSIRKLQQLGLRSPLALSLAKDDATRAALQGDDSPEGRRLRADEEEWPAILSDPERWRERVEAHLKAGGNPNHLSARWRTPLGFALERQNAELVRHLISRGADPAALVASPRPDPAISAAFADSGLRFEPWGQGTAFYGWLLGNLRNDGRTVPPELDGFAVAVVAHFWRNERDPRLPAQMLALAERSGLSATAAWMRAHR